MFYWRLRTGPPEQGGYYVYFKTKNRYVQEMIVDLAVRAGDLHHSFTEKIDEVTEVSQEEFNAFEWDQQ